MNKNTCKKIREKRREGYDYRHIADSFGVRLLDAVIHGEGYSDTDGSIPSCNCSSGDPSPRRERPWREPAVLECLYIDNNIGFTRIGEILSCNKETVQNQVDKGGVGIIPKEKRSSSPTIRKLQRAARSSTNTIDLDEPGQSARRYWDEKLESSQ